MKSVLCLLVLVAVVASDRTFSFTPRTSRWVLQEGKPSSDMKLKVGFGLKVTSPELLDSTFWDVSTPGSPHFGQHLSLEKMRSMFQPSAAAVETVKASLEEAGAEDITLLASGDFVTAVLSVRQIEQAFKTELGVYTHHKSGNSVVRAVSPYTLSSALSEVVEVIPGLHGFPPSGVSTLKKAEASPVDVDPDYLYKAYAVTEATGPVFNNSQAVLEFGNAYYSASDLQSFFNKYDPVMKGQDIQATYGPNETPNTSIEANLDVQYIMAMGNFVNTYIYTQAVDGDIIDAFVDYTTFVLSQTDPALVHSISFGEYGGDYDNSTVQYLNTQFQKMGLRGISILLASGDNGVGCARPDCSKFEFDFPSSPYITMVGATEFDSHGHETGATLSSGGFSEDYYRPSYQNDAVNGYFNSGVDLPASSYYYAAGRGYPDVAAAGVDLRIFNKGKDMAVSGTSCSAPIFAGLIALMNNERMKNGKGSLGFLNPFLYGNPDAFTDITQGNNQDCPVFSGCCCPGFNAYQGWDPVTGLGSPLYPKLLAAALAA